MVTLLLRYSFPSGPITCSSTGTPSPNTAGTGTRTATVYTPACPGTVRTAPTAASTLPTFTDTVPWGASLDQPNPVPQSRISSPGCAGCAATSEFRAIASSLVPENETTPRFCPASPDPNIHGEALCIVMLTGPLTPDAVSTATASAVSGGSDGQTKATTVQACGLNPFIAGAGAPVIGTPVGRHQLGGEVVCLDPLAWLRAGLTTNPGLFLLGQPGAGKALDAATPIPVPAGWAAIGDLRPGDYVFDEHGRPVPVIAASEVMTGRPCLEMTFDEATSITADASHQWVTAAPAAAVTAGSGPGPAAVTQVRTTRQIMDTLTGPGGEPAHSVAAAGPLELPGVYLLVPPWLLGAWLFTSAARLISEAPGFEAM